MAEESDRLAFERAVRRRRRRRRARRLLLSNRTGAVVVGVAVAGLLAAGFTGAGPLGSLGRRSGSASDGPVADLADLADLGAGEDASAAAASPVPDTSTTTTSERHIERRFYEVGDCVWWDDANTRASTLFTRVVPCDEPHLMEVTGRHKVTDQTGAYPREAFWDALFDSGPCLALAEEYIGAKLDPNGNFYAHGVLPSAESWSSGDREVWCGIGVWPYDAEQNARPGHAESTGRVAAASQYRIYPVGSCIGEAGSGDRTAWGVVPCDAPHRMEVAGHLDLSGRVQELPADEDAWDRVVGDDCNRLARAYAGAALRDPVGAGWLMIEAGSWDAGRRTLLCTVSEYRGQEAATITRRIGR